MTTDRVTKSVRLTQQESETLAQISEQEQTSESAILRRFVREGLSQYRLDMAIAAYTRGEIDLGAAAHHADTSVYHLMAELEKRGIEPPAAAAKFANGLKTLMETFGGSSALRETLAEFEASEQENE
jgi:hypothetical protein